MTVDGGVEAAARATTTVNGNPRFATPWWLLLTPVLPSLLSWSPAGRWLLPLLAPLTVYPAFVTAVADRRTGRAWLLGIAWAALLSVGVVVVVASAPGRAADLVLHGETYRQEMFTWIEHGVGPEVSPREFIPQHLIHLGAFVALAWASGGALGLVLGAVLVDYMSYFVASYGVAAGHPVLGSLVAWVPWSVVRVAAFVLLGALFARPLVERRLWPFRRRDLVLIAVAAVGLLVDIAVKTTLAPSYGEFLSRLAGGTL